MNYNISKSMSKFFLLILMLFLFFSTAFAQTNNENKVILYLFYGRGCPHCAQEIDFLNKIKEEYPSLEVIKKETYFNQENREQFEKMSEAFGENIEGVPTTFIDDKVIVGFSSSIRKSIEEEIKNCLEVDCGDPAQKVKSKETTIITGDSSPVEEPGKEEMKKNITLPAVLGAAIVDAINPCAFAVLIILLTTVLGARKKKRILGAGLAFTASIYISYFLMGIGLYSAVQATGITDWFYLIVGILAIFIGLFNLKDYLWYGKWFKMEVPESWRPKLKSILKGVTSIPGAFLIGFVVSLFLLPCTSGPYIVILGLLAKAATRDYAIMMLLLYNLVFILPMLILTLVIYFGLTTVEKAEKWRKGKLEVLHLIAGIIILLLGIGMLTSLWFGWI